MPLAQLEDADLRSTARRDGEDREPLREQWLGGG